MYSRACYATHDLTSGIHTREQFGFVEDHSSQQAQLPQTLPFLALFVASLPQLFEAPCAGYPVERCTLVGPDIAVQERHTGSPDDSVVVVVVGGECNEAKCAGAHDVCADAGKGVHF